MHWKLQDLKYEGLISRPNSCRKVSNENVWTKVEAIVFAISAEVDSSIYFYLL